MNNNSILFKKKTPLILFLTPAFVFLVVYLYVPFAQTIYNSFFTINGLGNSAEKVNSPWYENYVKLFTDPIMGTAMKNTVILLISTIIFQVGIALILALLIDNIKVGTEFFRTVYFFPIVISASALGLMFNLVFLYNGGMLNQLIRIFNETAEFVDWKDPEHFMATMLVPVMWQYVGFYFVIIVTGLNNISHDIYEAASIDGASGFQRVRYITLPLIHNVLCTCLTLAITGALKVFDLPYVMFKGGLPLDKSWLTGTYMYSVTLEKMNVDYGCAIAIVIVVLGVLLSQISSKIFKEKDL